MTTDLQSALAAAMVTLLVSIVIGIGGYVWYALALSKLFRDKLGAEGWRGWVPILNEATILALGGVAAWKVVFAFLPVVQLYWIYLKVIAVNRINAGLGRGAGMTVLGILLPPVWASILAWGRTDGAELSRRMSSTLSGEAATGPLAGSPEPGRPAVPAFVSPFAPQPAGQSPSAPAQPAAPASPFGSDQRTPPPVAPTSTRPFADASPASAGSAPAPAPAPAPEAAPTTPEPAAPAPVLIQNPWAPRVAEPATAPAAPPAPAPALPPSAEPAPETPPSAASFDDELDAEATIVRHVAGPADEDEDDDLSSTVVVDRRPRTRWFLVVDGGHELELLGDRAVLGRKPGGDEHDVQYLPVPDQTRTLSKTHARLDRADDVWTVTDLHSTNGVIIVDDAGVENLLPAGTGSIVEGRFILGRVGMSLRFEERR